METELRGEWPGGIERDDAGRVQFESSCIGDLRPIWHCSLCAKKLKHTQAEHDALTRR
jgi:hypothetical protein